MDLCSSHFSGALLLLAERSPQANCNITAHQVPLMACSLILILALSSFLISSSASLCLSNFLSYSRYSLCYPFVILIMSVFSLSVSLQHSVTMSRVGEKRRGGKRKNQPGERGLHHIQLSNGLLTSAHQ